MMWHVYALREPGSTEARYVGMTSAPRNRISQHRTLHRRMPVPSAFATWLRTSGFELTELAVFDTAAAARVAERQTVVLFRAMGHRLFNHWLVPRDKRLYLREAA